MSDTTPVAYLTPSTASVPPQNRMQDSDVDVPIVVQFDGTASDQHNIALARKCRVTRIQVVNDDVAMAAASHTTAVNVDSEDGAGTKTHDIAAKAAATTCAADAFITLTLSTTEADLVVENTEIIRVDSTVVGTQGSFSVVIWVKWLEATDVAGAWPLTP